MRILAIETSCDDTGVAIVENGTKVLVNLVESQIKLHRPFGGVVPEIASREHIRSIYGLVDKALAEAKLKPKQIDRIAVTYGPGLVGSLLVGLGAGQMLSYLWKKPLQPVNHLAGHLYASVLSGAKFKFPALVLLVSGGHSQLILMKGHGKFQTIGQTRDDAAGEAFDKIAKILGLPYPGGPEIAKLATNAKARTKFLPRPMIDSKDLDFSFSGLKTAVTREVGHHQKVELAYDAEQAIAEVLISKTKQAAKLYKPKQIILAGGVASNQVLRARATAELGEWELVYPNLKYCTDNAAMIGAAAYFLPFQPSVKWYNTDVKSSLEL